MDEHLAFAFFSHDSKIFIKLALICIPKIWSELWIWKNEFTTNNNNWNSICIKNLFLSYFSFFHVRCVNWERNNKPYSIYGYIIEINVLNGGKGLYLTCSRQRVIYVLLLSAQVDLVVSLGCSFRYHENNVVFIMFEAIPICKGYKNGRKLKERISVLFKLNINACF